MVLLSYFSILLSVFGSVIGFDPFEGTQPILECVKCRRISTNSCNKTLLEAYKETEASKTDHNINDADTKAYLFTRFNKKHPECLHLCGKNLPPNTLYDPNKKTIIIIGGHLTSFCTFTYFREMKTQLLCRDNYNVIVIDWSWGNGADIYGSMRNTQVAGKQVAFLIRTIMRHTGTTICEKIHIVGHAFGAHAAGYVGQYIKQWVPTCVIERITGLDPFGGAFNAADETIRLDPSDAELVDVIHTGKGDCFPFWLGTNQKIGHADFYPNGGSIQMSCHVDGINAFLKGDNVVGVLSLWPGACYLFQSIRYFISSINPCQCTFIGVECTSYEDFASGNCRSCGEDGTKCAVMGMDYTSHPHQNGSHSYYLDTSLLCPYCRNGDVNLQGFPDPNHVVGNGSELHCFGSCV